MDCSFVWFSGAWNAPRSDSGRTHMAYHIQLLCRFSHGERWDALRRVLRLGVYSSTRDHGSACLLCSRQLSRLRWKFERCSLRGRRNRHGDCGISDIVCEVAVLAPSGSILAHSWEDTL